jgi:hypothetical protein
LPLFHKIIKIMTVTIELLQEDAMAHLKHLEKLNILKLLVPQTTPTPAKKTPKSRFAGRISKATGQILHQQYAQMREEWT